MALTVREVIRNLEETFRIYGDIPCFIDTGSNVKALNSSIVGELTAEHEPTDTEAGTTVCIFKEAEPVSKD